MVDLHMLLIHMACHKEWKTIYVARTGLTGSSLIRYLSWKDAVSDLRKQVD